MPETLSQYSKKDAESPPIRNNIINRRGRYSVIKVRYEKENSKIRLQLEVKQSTGQL